MKKCILILIFLVLAHVYLAGQREAEGETPQLVFPEFTQARILMKSGQVQTQMMNYNSITETMVYIRGNNHYELTNPEIVDTVFMQGSKFIPVKGAFYEVLDRGDMPLFLQVKSELKPVGKDAGYGSTSHTSATTTYSSYSASGLNYNLKLPPDYTVETSYIYWINKTVSFETERQFLKLFPEKEDELKAFIKKNRYKFDNKESIIAVVKYCAGLYKSSTP
jgi:hypothetical protein